jgi:thioredoxin reductase (NADPH)
MVARSPLLESLGLEATDHPMGRTFPAGPMGASSVPGVFLAGNVTDPMASVIHAAAGGYSAGGAVHADLLQADLAALRGP